jgi:hypothetical protein
MLTDVAARARELITMKNEDAHDDLLGEIFAEMSDFIVNELLEKEENEADLTSALQASVDFKLVLGLVVRVYMARQPIGSLTLEDAVVKAEDLAAQFWQALVKMEDEAAQLPAQ